MTTQLSYIDRFALLLESLSSVPSETELIEKSVNLDLSLGDIERALILEIARAEGRGET